MSDINISIFSRLLSSYLQERPDVQGLVRNILEAANGDGQDNEEDNVLSDVEARRFIERQHEQARTLRRNLNILTSRRESLVGTLQAAQETLRRVNAPEEVLRLVQAAANQDDDHANLSLPELQAAIQQMQQLAEGLEHLNGDQFFQQVSDMARDLRQMETEGTEILFPENQVEQRASIDLNFLKSLEEGDWQAIAALGRRAANGEEVTPEDAQMAFYMSVLSMLNIAGIDPSNRAANWTLNFEQVQAAMQRMPLQAGESRPSPELMMAELRYAADSAQRDLGSIQGQRLLAHPERNDLGVSLQPLINGRPEIFSLDPRLQLFRDEAGSDGVLAPAELARSLRHMYRRSPQTAPDSATVMNELRVLVTARLPETPVEDSARARGGDPFIREMNRLVMGDLERMRDGFTERDRQLVDTMEAWDLIPRIGSNIVTLGGLTTGGDTYVEVRRGFADLAATRRGNALAELRRLLEHPEAASPLASIPNFQTWLSRRSGAGAQLSIPNALEYLRHVQPATAAMLDGSFFQATRLWNIRQEQDADRQARLWLSLASDLRGGYRGEGVTSVIHAVPNLTFARAILHSIRRESTNSDIRREARLAFQDSMGYEITDDNGNVTQGGQGELGLWPVDWFRNFPDEAVATAGSDAVFLGACLYGGGSIFRGLKGVVTAAGRRELMVGLSEFAGIRGTSAVVTVASDSVSLNSSGWFSRWMTNSATRQVAAAEARLAAATTEAELTTARTALARAQNVQRIISSPVVQTLAGNKPASEILGDSLQALGRRVAVLGYGMRGVGFGLRSLGWLAGEGIPRYAIASQLFNRVARRSRFPLILDREYSVDLPVRINNPAPAARDLNSRPIVLNLNLSDDPQPRDGGSSGDAGELRLVLPTRDAGAPGERP